MVTRTRLALLLVVAVATALLAAGTAAAAERTHEIDLSRVVAKGVVRDNVFHGAAPKALPARIETFIDSHGHVFRIGTDVPALDLAPYANVLASTRHRGETGRVLVEVVAPEGIAAICGADAVACYYNDRSPGVGWMYVPTVDPDLVHVLVHEYGHHVDNQLLNLAHLDRSCGVLGDGSRNWLFARSPSATFTCTAARWDLDLGELFAEDYVALNGIRQWVLPTIRPPRPAELSALAFDFANPFRPRQLRKAGLVRRGGVLVKRFEVRHWTRVELRLQGPRAADLDVFLFRNGKRQPIAAGTRPGSRELVVRVVRPGRYAAVVYANRAAGSASLRIFLD